MLKIDVLYSQAPVAAIRETLKEFGKEVRIESMVNDTLAGVWIDIDANYNASNRLARLADVCIVLDIAGHQPFLVTHETYSQTRPVVVDGSTGHLSIHKRIKEYSELLTFGDECKQHLWIKYDTLCTSLSASLEITHIWLLGNHYTVRKAKRFIANAMSNGNTHLTTRDLERVKQLIGSDGRVYMLSNIGRLIDLVNSRLVTAGGFMPHTRDLLLTNSQALMTGLFVERIQETTNLDNILRSADNK